MTDYKLSAAIHKLKKQYGMAEPEYLIFADLKAAGWNSADAWAVAFQGQGLHWSKNQFLAEIKAIENLESVQNRIAEVQGRKIQKDGLSADELAKETSKEKILTDLVLAKKSQKPGTKEWNDLTKMIADYNKIKQDEIQTEDSTIHFYIPVSYPNSCKECLIAKNGKQTLIGKKKVNNDE